MRDESNLKRKLSESNCHLGAFSLGTGTIIILIPLSLTRVNGKTTAFLPIERDAKHRYLESINITIMTINEVRVKPESPTIYMLHTSKLEMAITLM